MMPFYPLLFVLSQNDFVENVVTLVKSFEDPKETLEMRASVSGLVVLWCNRYHCRIISFNKV